MSRPDERDLEIQHLRTRVWHLERDLRHARYSANAHYASTREYEAAITVVYLQSAAGKRASARALWERSAPHCEHPASDGWEAGMDVEVRE